MSLRGREMALGGEAYFARGAVCHVRAEEQVLAGRADVGKPAGSVCRARDSPPGVASPGAGAQGKAEKKKPREGQPRKGQKTKQARQRAASQGAHFKTQQKKPRKGQPRKGQPRKGQSVGPRVRGGLACRQVLPVHWPSPESGQVGGPGTEPRLIFQKKFIFRNLEKKNLFSKMS